MAYGKSKYRRRYACKGRARVANLARGKTTAVQALAKSVRRLQREVRGATPYLNYSQTFSGGVSADFNQYPLSKYSTWTRIFGTDVNDDTGNKMKHVSIGIDMYISLENLVNEPDTTGFTCFLVSLKDEIGGLLNQATGDLTLYPNTHYVINNGMVMLNKKMFNIHRIKRFTLSNHGQALSLSSAQTQGGTDARFYWKIKPRKNVKCAYGDWKVNNCSQDISDNMFVFVFNDNASVDLQNPVCRMSVVHTVQSYN